MARVYLLVSAAEDGWLLCRHDGSRADSVSWQVSELAAAVTELERAERPRWVFTGGEYARLLRSGVRVHRCHDLELTEAILLGFEGTAGQPATLAAAWARLAGLPVPEGSVRTQADSGQPALFETAPGPLPGGVSREHAAAEVLTEQLRRIAATPWAPRLRLLLAAESAGALAAAEMYRYGLPWRADVHRQLLTGLLGPRPASGAQPKVLAELATRISEAFGGKPVNPEHPGSVQRAFAREGIDLPSTRAAVLRELDHPAAEPLLRYKELSRLYAAHGWAWLDEWVQADRFHPDLIVGGVVSGRWASRGGAALQLPKLLRTCVRADPGSKLVVADAAQLEPRVLAALSADERLAEHASTGDLYTGLAEDAFDGRRHDAKVAMLSAMYGGTAGRAAELLAALRKRFPEAIEYVERAARHGEQGRAVRSALGRTSPPPAAIIGEDGLDSPRGSRDWGRFTRNFVVQSSAADWAGTVLATLRLSLLRELPRAELVFFQHDEIIVHCAESEAPRCAELVAEAAEQASRLVFGASKVRFPLPASIVDCYAEAK